MDQLHSLYRHLIPLLVALLAILFLFWLEGRIRGRLVALVGKGTGERRARSAGKLLSWSFRLFALIAFGTVLLKETGLDITPLLTGAGIFGVAFGLGAQSLLKDLLNGLFILLEGQFAVGDRVELAGKSGVVEEINLRTTVLRDSNGAMHVVPNGQITVSSRLPPGSPHA